MLTVIAASCHRRRHLESYALGANHRRWYLKLLNAIFLTTEALYLDLFGVGARIIRPNLEIVTWIQERRQVDDWVAVDIGIDVYHSVQVLLVMVVIGTTAATDGVAIGGATAQLTHARVVRMAYGNLVAATEEIVEVVVLEAVVVLVDVDDLRRIIWRRPQEVEVKVLLQEADNNAKSEELDNPALDTVNPVGKHVHFRFGSCYLLLVILFLFCHCLFILGLLLFWNGSLWLVIFVATGILSRRRCPISSSSGHIKLKIIKIYYQDGKWNQLQMKLLYKESYIHKQDKWVKVDFLIFK